MAVSISGEGYIKVSSVFQANRRNIWETRARTISKGFSFRKRFHLPNILPYVTTREDESGGRGGRENVIHLGIRRDPYQMTLSDDGRRVSGTWGSNGDPRNVEFSSVKVSDHAALERDRMSIRYQWNDLDHATYGQENRDR
jgi:hypothetical protein